MGITRDLNVEPYFDDFEPVALDKNYHRVLFKPSVAVQARELTQIQSILQNQIERFSDNILVEGTIVKGGNFVEVNPLPYVKILDNNTNNQPVVLENYVGLKAVGVTTGVEAQIITFATGFQSQSPDLNTLYVKYTSASTSTSYAGQDTFNTTENINIVNSTGEIVTTVTAAGVREGNDAIGNGYGVRCGEGIMYQKGHFITFEDQIVVLDKYTTQPNGVVVGFRIEESFVDSFTDESLLDNAAGFPNENAPGADRLQLIPVLEVKTVAEAQAQNNYFAIQEYQNGRVVRRHTRTQYSIIGDEIARRTSEESGNYSLGKFKIRVDQHIANTVSGEVSTEKLQASVNPGVAYVDGNRVEILAEYRQLFDKATDFLTEEQQNITAALGNYVVVTDYLGDFDFTKLPSVELRSVAHTETSLDPATASPASPGSVIGTARVRSVVKETESRYRLYLFDIDVTDGDFSNVKAIRFDGDSQAGLANVVLDANSQARLVDTNFKKAIFPLGRQFIKTVSGTNCDYVSRTKNTVSGLSSASEFSITLGADEEWPYSGTLTTDLIREFVVIPDSTSGSYTAGEPIASSDPGSGVYITQIEINGSGTQATVSLSDAYSGDMIVYHNVKKTSVNPIGKELDTYYTRIAANTHADLASGTYSLGVPDAFEIDTIWKGSNNTFTEAEAIADSLSDVTSQFTLINNSKDGLYDLSYIQKKSFAQFGDDDSLLVKFKAFTKNTSSGDGFDQSFFSIDSYPLPDSGSPSPETITIEQLPVYTSEAGVEYNLRDVLDFRPYAANAVSYSTDSSTAPLLDTSVDDLTKAATFGVNDLNLPAPNKAIELDYEYYLARIDKMYLDSEGQVGVIKGISAELPTAPRLPENVMELATLLVAPFPSLPASVANRAGHPEYSVAYITPQNRRYTMQDIGKIDRRVKQIEYYTALNSLEKKADDLSVQDSNGLNRFKNGIFVDNFSTYNSADVKNQAFSSSIDPSIGEIAPRHRQWFLDMRVESTTGNIKTDNDAITLDYSEVPVIEQPFSSITRSCTNDFYKFTGEIVLFPEYDSGTDTTRAPDIQLPEVDLVGAFSDFAEALNEVITIQGQTVDVDTQSTTTTSRNPWWWWWGQTSTTTTTTTTTTTDNEFEVLAGQETSEVVGDFVTDARFSPFLRSVEVEVEVFGLLPNKTLYFYFDGQPVAQHIASAELMSQDSLDAREPGDQRILNRTSEFGATEIVADSNGSAKAIFRIPAETFYVGDRLLEVSSEPTYESIENSVSYAKKMYRGYNFSVEKSSLISTTREPEFRSSQTVTTETDVQTQSVRTGGWWWNNWWWWGGRDPLAQTFFITADMSADTTVQITSLDVFFASKSSAGRAVSVEIVEAVNGFPGDKVVPFSSIRKEAADVQVDASNALIPTTFEFKAPVTLQTDREYAIIVQPEGNDPEYTVWVARTGDRDVTTGVNLVTDTNAGVLFTSSNKRVWTPYQDQNLKFTLNKASFETAGGTSSVKLTNKNHEFFEVGSVSGEFTGDEFVFVDKTDGDAGFLGTSNNITVTEGSRTITTSETGAFNGIESGDFVVAKSDTTRQVLKVISNTNDDELTVREPVLFSNTAIELFTTVTGRLSTVHTSNIDDQVMMTLYNSSAKTGDVFATSDTLRGAESNSTCTILSVYDIPASYFNANIYRTASPGTTVTATFDSQPLELSKTKYITSPTAYIKSRSNEIVDDGGTNSFAIDVNMTGTADSSPLIDYQISTVLATEYIFNNLADDDVTEKTNFGDAKSKYISKVIELAEGMDASDMRLYLTGYRPVGSDIKIYVKLQNSSDLRSFESINWTEMELKDASDVFSNSTRRRDFREFEYQFKTAEAAVAGDNAVKIVSGTDVADEITYKTPTGNEFNTYKYFAIKIVLEATDHANIPRVNDIRAIALA